MNTETNFMSFENLIKLIEKHKKETHPYKRYEFDSASYTLLLIDINNLLKENKDLKKQLEEYKYSHSCSFVDTCKNVTIANYNQQKEFINYLEDEIKRINPKELGIGELNLRLDDIKFTQYLIYKEILQKYKSIIGDDK